MSLLDRAHRILDEAHVPHAIIGAEVRGLQPEDYGKIVSYPSVITSFMEGASLAGKTVGIVWRDRRIDAWVPDALARRDLSLSIDVVRRSERAAAAVRLADEHLPPSWEPLARLLMRAEGLASSQIEGIRAPVAAVAAAELDPDFGGPTAAWVADNLAVVAASIAEAAAGPLTVAALHRWHARLMRHGSLPVEMVGRFRPAQGWIGGSSPLDAAYVPPPPDLIADLMDDLVAFANREDIDPVTQASLLHAQFETIHPYGDGNGRIGRVLVGWVLARRAGVQVPPPVSVLVSRDVGGYLSGLYAFRAGNLETWVGWFADVVRRAAEGMVNFVDRIEAITSLWRDQVSDLRNDAAARVLVEVLTEQPVLTAAHAAQKLGVSERAARSALRELSERSIIERLEIAPAGAGRPRRWWLVPALLDAIGSWPE